MDLAEAPKWAASWYAVRSVSFTANGLLKISAAETFQQKMAAEGDIMDQCADHREIQEGLIDLCVFSWKMAAGRNALWIDQ